MNALLRGRNILIRRLSRSAVHHTGWSLGIAATMLGLGIATVNAQPTDTVVRVGIYQNEPKVFIDETNTPAGFWVDLTNHIAEQEGWTLQYVPCQWEGCLEATAEGDLDLMVDVAYSEARDRRLAFNQEVVIASWSVVYAQPGNAINSLLDLDQQRVAVLRGSIQHDDLARQADAFNIRPQFIEVDTFEAIFQLLEAGQVDAGVVNRFVGQQAESRYRIARTSILVYPSRLHYVTAEDRNADLLAAIDRQLVNWMTDADSVFYRAEERWLEPRQSQLWLSVRHLLLDLAVLLPIVGLAIAILRNRYLDREIYRRQQAESRLQTLANNTPGVIYRYELRPDGSDRLLYVSPGCRDLWGIEAEAAMREVGQIWRLTHPDDLPAMQEAVQVSARLLTPLNCEWRIETPLGQQKWLQASAVPQRQKDGSTVWDGMILDISDRKFAEIQSQETQRRLKLATSAAQIGIWDLDIVHDRLLWDAHMHNLYGVPVDRFGGSLGDWQQRIHPEDLSMALQTFQAAVQQDEPFHIEFRIVQPTGAIRFIEAQAIVLRDAAGHPLRMIGVNWDITDRRQSEEALRHSEQRFRNLAANVPGALFRYVLHPDGSNRVVYMSQGCSNLWEVDADTAVENAQVLWDMVHPDDLEGMYASVMQSAQTLQPWKWQWRITTPSGQEKWLEAAGRPELHRNGDVVWDTLVIDVSDRKLAEAALQASEERLRLVTENMSDLVCLHQPDGRYLYVTPSSYSLLGYRPQELIGRDPYEFFHPEDRDLIYRQSHEPALQSMSASMIYRMQRKTGEYIWLETLTQPILDATGQVIHLQTTSRNVSDRVRAEAQLKHDALHDGLTGLPNRNLLMERLDLALKRARHTAGFRFAVLFLDLDNFKVVNDSLGHLVGDELLLTVSHQLLQFIRETDIAARLGGDEFVILLEDIDGLQDAVRVAERILDSLRVPLMISNREVFISASIGIVPGSTVYQRAEELLRDADLAMYRAKHSGRARYAIFDPAMHLQVLQRLHLEQDLRKALDNQEFTLYYQPIISLETERVYGFEALVRWQHPQRGQVMPGNFIAIAEETGLIVPIGRWILQTACQQLADWQTQFPTVPLRMSVNLSVQQLQTSLIQQVDEVLSQSGVQSDRLVLEITESMLVDNVEATLDLLTQLKARGLRLSIDDFGTGYSSLSYLSRLPVDSLKIDRAFVNPSEIDSRNQVIAESIIALSNLLEINAIAEGLETVEQLRWLKQLGCELGQGFWFSKPLPARRATELIAREVSSTSRGDSDYRN